MYREKGLLAIPKQFKSGLAVPKKLKVVLAVSEQLNVLLGVSALFMAFALQKLHLMNYSKKSLRHSVFPTGHPCKY